MGEFDLFGLSGIMQTIADHDQTGTLRVQKDEKEIYLYFNQGKLQMLASPHKRSILAEALMRCGRISPELVEKIFAKQREMKKSLLATLQEADFGDPNLKDTVFLAGICQSQISEEVYEIFSWPNVHCEFMEKQAPDIFSPEMLELPIVLDPGGVVLESARRQDEWNIIRQILPANKDVPFLVQQDEASAAEMQKKFQKENEGFSKELIDIICSHINGIRDFDEILGHVRIAHFKAMKLFSKLVEYKRIRLKTAEELKQMINLDILRQDTFKCIRLYERVEELGLKNFDTIMWLAKAYEHAGLTSKAGEKYRELGATAMDQHLYEEAVRAYNKVVDFAPEDLESYKKLINAYKMLPGVHAMRDKGTEIATVYARKVAVMDKRNAIAILDEANKNFRSTPNNLELMANLYQQMGDKGNAISTYNILANLMKKQKDVEKTLDAYHKILAIDSSNIKAHLEIAKGLGEAGKNQEALQQYKDLGALLVEYVRTQNAPITMEEASSNLIHVCETIIQFEQHSIEAREWLVDVYIAMKQEKTALNILRDLLNLLQKEQDLRRLVNNLQKAVAMDSEEFNNRRLLADTLQKLEQKVPAIQEYLQLGLLTYQHNDMRRSREAFEAIIAIDPFNLVARQKHAEILGHLNLHARAVEEYRLVGYLHKAVNQIPEAIHAFAKMVELSPGKELAGILEVARLCENQKDYKKAIYYYKMYANENYKRGNLGETHFACSRITMYDPKDVESQKFMRYAESKFHAVQAYIPPK
jgi:tetratricopeptide (TPR) repeat protein